MDQTEQRIRERAYQLWEQEGRPEGRADRHWHAARDQLADASWSPVSAAEIPPSRPSALGAGQSPLSPATTAEAPDPDIAMERGDHGPLSEIDTIHRTLETGSWQPDGLSPLGAPAKAMGGNAGRRDS